MRKGNVVYYLHGDHLGSTSLTTDAGGGLVSQARYLPYGETRWGTQASAPTDFGYTGQRQEAGFGLYDYNARFYSPVLGRFISADTIVPEPAGSQGWNRYSYTRNNPLKYSDPTGYCEKNAEGGYVSQDCVDIAKRVANDWGIGLDEALTMDLKYGSDPNWFGGDDRVNFKPFTLNVNGEDRFVQVGDQWAFEVNYRGPENKDISFNKIVLANRDDTAFANFANSLTLDKKVEKAVRELPKPPDGRRYRVCLPTIYLPSDSLTI